MFLWRRSRAGSSIGVSAEAILGGIDAIKLRSSLTLFEAAAGEGSDPYATSLEALYRGERDPATLARL